MQEFNIIQYYYIILTLMTILETATKLCTKWINNLAFIW